MASSRDNENKAFSAEEKDWWDIIKDINRLRKSNELQVLARKSKKDWEPMIDNLELMVKQAKEKHKTLAEDKSKLSVAEQKNEKDKIEHFINLAEKMIDQAKNLTESVSFDLYKVNSEEDAKKINSNHAVVIYPDQNGVQQARVINKKIDSDRAYDLYCIKFDEKPSDDIIRKKIGIKNIPLLIKHGNDIYVYGSSTGRRDKFELIKLDNFPIAKASIFPSDAKSFGGLGSININKIKKSGEHRDIYKAIKEKNGHTPDIDTIVTVPNSITKTLSEQKRILSVDKNGEVDITEENITCVTDITKELSTLAGANIAEKSTKELVSGALQLAESLPAVLKAFRELPLAKEAGKALEQFKAVTEELNVSGLIKEILPINDYLALRSEMFKLLKAEEFNKRSPDEKAGILALLEVYNEAIKYSVLALDKIEIEAGLTAGSLSTSIKIVENKTIKDLCDEFNTNYANAMKLAGYKTLPEMYPYKDSIHAQHKAMLAELPEDKDKPSVKRARIASRMEAAGEVKELPDRKNAQSFYTFMKETLKENYERVKELQKRIASQTTEVKKESNSDLSETIGDAVKFIDQVDAKLRNYIDPDVYHEYFIEGKPSLNAHWIEAAGEAFVNVRKIIKKIEYMQSKANEVKDTNTPFARLEHRAKEMDEIASAGMELIGALHQIKNNPQLKRLIGKDMVEILPGKITIKKSTDDAKHMILSIKNSEKPLVESLRSLARALDVGAKKHGLNTELTNEASQAVGKIELLVSDLQRYCDNVDKQANEKPDIIAFAAAHFIDIVDIVTKLPIILGTMNQLSQEEAKSRIIEINNALKGMVILCDKLEVQFCLREGVLANMLLPAIESFQGAVSDLGYGFKPEDRYPYKEAVKAHRQFMLSPDSPATSPLERELLRDRIDLAENLNVHKKEYFLASLDENEVRKKFKKDNPQATRKERIELVIATHIGVLGKQADPTYRNEKELEIIRRKVSMLQLLCQSKYENISDKLNELRGTHADSIHLLYEGATADILEQLEHLNASPKDITTTLTAEIELLKKQRGASNLFYSKEKAKLLENRISICEKLRELIKDHTLNDAIKALEPAEQAILNKYDYALIDRLKIIENAIPNQKRTKTILGKSKAVNDSEPIADLKHVAGVIKSSPEQAYAIELVNKRISALDSAIITTATKAAKLIVLKELNKALVNNVPLDAALKHVKMNESTKQHAHLLFEGRTGKAIRAAQNATITKSQLIHRIDAEINSLKHQRYSKLYVFSGSRKRAVDGQLEALQALKNVLVESRDQNVASIVNTILKGPHGRVLEQTEGDLLKDLNRFENARPKRNVSP